MLQSIHIKYFFAQVLYALSIIWSMLQSIHIKYFFAQMLF